MMTSVSNALSDEDFDVLARIVTVLQPFHELTVLLSRRDSPTIHLVAPRLFRMNSGLVKGYHMFYTSSRTTSLLCSKLLVQLKNAWDFESCFEAEAKPDSRKTSTAKTSAAKTSASKSSDDKPQGNGASTISETLFLLVTCTLHPYHRDLLFLKPSEPEQVYIAAETFLSQVLTALSLPQVPSQGHTTTKHSAEARSGQLYASFDDCDSTDAISIQQQYRSYLKADLKSLTVKYKTQPNSADPAQFRLLDFWQAYSSLATELSAVAKVLLSIPASSIAAEASFSVMNLIVDKRRTRLLPDLVNDLAVLFSFHNASQRGNESMDFMDLFATPKRKGLLDHDIA
jgi:hypothetical protein